MRRFLLAGGNEAEVDKQGRVTLPSSLVRKVGLGREVVVAGVGELLEVWDRETWQRKSAEFEERRDVVAERLAARES
jgi:MraZ protein